MGPNITVITLWRDNMQLDAKLGSTKAGLIAHVLDKPPMTRSLMHHMLAVVHWWVIRFALCAVVSYPASMLKQMGLRLYPNANHTIAALFDSSPLLGNTYLICHPRHT